MKDSIREISFIELRTTPDRGRGIFATEKIKAKTAISPYTGSVMSSEEGELLLHLQEQQGKPVYIFDLPLWATQEDYDENIHGDEPEWCIDGDNPDNVAGIINHSCEPNCVVEEVHTPMWYPMVGTGTLKRFDCALWYVTSRDIAKGEELTVNYGFPCHVTTTYRHPCHCGSKKCKGFMVAAEQRKLIKKMLPLWRKYGLVPDA